jgi:hypothetical protein
LPRRAIKISRATFLGYIPDRLTNPNRRFKKELSMKLRSVIRLAPTFVAVIALSTAQVQAQAEKPGTDKATQPANDAAKGAAPQKKATPVANQEAAGHYESEAQARAHCRGHAVVWADKDNFNHYPGSREYGRKPGAFVCAAE